MVKIGIVGVGTVGVSVAKILEDNREIIGARAGKEIKVIKGVVKNLTKDRGIKLPITDNYRDITDDNEIDIVVELMGGVEEAKEVVQRALKNGKSVVTANKALLAYHRYELEEMCADNALAYEASVAGGIPIIKSLRDGLSANHIMSIKGIINGTCNYMLTKMTNEGVDFDEILKESQALGYAEADPTFDIGGFDAAHKLLILASIAYGIDAKPEDILIDGIEEITGDDIDFAKEFGYAIKHLGIAKKAGDKVSLRVHASLVPNTQMIAKVDGVMNGISVVGDKVGETMYYGAGAGGDATASAVISDIIDIVRGNKTAPMLGFKKSLEHGLSLLPKDEIESEYYIRLLVKDETGVLAEVTSIFAKHKISIGTVLQRENGEKANLLLSTHIAKERDLQDALIEIEKLSSVACKPVMIRIER